ncbi:hypothetical protein BH11PAT1_BH11PAT1_0540 [soil metagenome]
MYKGERGFYQEPKLIISHEEMQAQIRGLVQEFGASFLVINLKNGRKDILKHLRQNTTDYLQVGGEAWVISRDDTYISLAGSRGNSSGGSQEEAKISFLKNGKLDLIFSRQERNGDLYGDTSPILKYKNDPHALSGAVKLQERFKRNFVRSE